MSFLKHPIRSIREPFGTAGLIVACVALVAALGGTALAAAKLNGTQKKEVEKIAKKYAGKPGANGAPGAPGAKGETGAAGANGTNGTNGTPGAKGESVTIKAYEGEECPTEEGTEFSNTTGKSYACNGENGLTGFTDTLPPEKSEFGMWSVGPYPGAAAGFQVYAPLSFNIPLKNRTEPNVSVHYIPEEAAGTPECPGTIGSPAAAPGNLCIYAQIESGTTFKPPSNPETSFSQAGRAGILLFFELASANAKARGVWVVTAPAA